MAVVKTRLGNKEDGSPLYHYSCPDGHLVQVGPITGTVTLKSGDVVDVTDDYIEAKDVKQAQEIADLVAKRYQDEGHPSHLGGTPFTYGGKA